MFAPGGHKISRAMRILVRNGQRKHKIDSRLFKKRLAKILEALEQNPCELSVLLTGDRKIKKLNSQYRKVDSATDVLSFPQDSSAVDEQGIPLLGDVVISVETAARQAKEHLLTLDEELALLAIHGILHLRGLDHERSSKEARLMQRQTRDLFTLIFPGRQPSGTSNF